MIDTKQKILETAERLFGEKGYEATSLRQIIGEAGVNLAAVHYHFGSKQELLDELVMRKAGPVNAARMAMLDEAERRAAGQPLPVEVVLRALLVPMAEAANQHPEFVKLMGRVIREGLILSIVERHFQPVVGRIVGALRRSLPHLTDEEFHWRVHFTIGAMAHTMCGPPGLLRLEESDFRNRIERLVAYASGGLLAPATSAVEAVSGARERGDAE